MVLLKSRSRRKFKELVRIRMVWTFIRLKKITKGLWKCKYQTSFGLRDEHKIKNKKFFLLHGHFLFSKPCQSSVKFCLGLDFLGGICSYLDIKEENLKVESSEKNVRLLSIGDGIRALVLASATHGWFISAIPFEPSNREIFVFLVLPGWKVFCVSKMYFSILFVFFLWLLHRIHIQLGRNYHDRSEQIFIITFTVVYFL